MIAMRPRDRARGAWWLALAIAALVFAGCAPANEPVARLARALDSMERLQGFRFELISTSEATGSGATAPIRSEVRITGVYAAPDRMRARIEAEGGPAEIVIVGTRQWIDGGAGLHQTVATPAGPLRDARAPLTFLRGGGAASFAGPGLVRGSVTYRVRLELSAGDLAERMFEGVAVPPDARGTIEVELGLLEDRVWRQTVEITSSADGAGSGIDTVRTTYQVEYWAHGEPQEVREPE